MAVIGRYDTELQMFVDEPHDIDRRHLEFQRWLVERGLAGQGPAGEPSGPLAGPPIKEVPVDPS